MTEVAFWVIGSSLSVMIFPSILPLVDSHAAGGVTSAASTMACASAECGVDDPVKKTLGIYLVDVLVPDGRAANHPFSAITFRPPMEAPLQELREDALDFLTSQLSRQYLRGERCASVCFCSAVAGASTGHKRVRRTRAQARGRLHQDRGPCAR